MVAMKIRQLIDLAIGFPETSHVNFSALHCLLIRMAEKLAITDDIFNYDESEYENNKKISKLANCRVLKKRARLIGGLNPDDENDSTNANANDNANANENETANEPDNLSVAASIAEVEQIMMTDSQQQDNDIVIQDQTAEEDIEATLEDQNMPDVFAATQEVATEEIEQQSLDKEEDSIRNSVLLEEFEPERLSELISINESPPSGEDFLTGISILKHQLEFVMEQLLLLTYLSLSKKPDFQQIQQLYSMTQKLDELKKENIPIRGLKYMPLPFDLTLNWISSNLKMNEEDLVENHNIMEESSKSSYDTLEGHLCYTPAKLLDQLMCLKSEFCRLTNNVNELSARLLQQESHHLLALIQEINKQIRDINLTIMDLKENNGRLELRITSNQNTIMKLKENLEEILENMVDKAYFEQQLANKADYRELQGKASLDQILELQCRIDKQFCEVCKRFKENDKRFSDTVENLKTTLGPTALNEVLAKFKQTIANDMQQLNDLLKTYIETTNDDCAAAGGRVKVLQGLACLSCDTNCVMAVREKSKVGKLPSAYASNIISPLVTYELGSIRKSGLMGYYRKDEFPHTPNAWLEQQSLALDKPKQSRTRHAGGQHTISSAKERFQKIMFNRK